MASTRNVLVAIVVLLAVQQASAIRIGLCKRLTRRQRQLAARDDFVGATCNTAAINTAIKAWCSLGVCGPLNRADCKQVIRAELVDNTFPANCQNIPTCTNEFCTTSTCRSSVNTALTYPLNCPEVCAVRSVTGSTCVETVCSPQIPTCPAGQVIDAPNCGCKFDGPAPVCTSDAMCADVNACRPGVCTDAGQCQNFLTGSCCVNDRSGRIMDSECTATSPICGTSVDSPVSLGQTGTTCYFCEDDRAANGVDNGCTATSPYCAAIDGTNAGTDGLGDACFVCQANSLAIDTGCPSDKPLCGLITKAPAALNDYGQACFKCINDGDLVDTGCTTGTPSCDAPSGQLGTTCNICKNTDAGTGVDFGCSAARPFCSTSSAADIALNSQGNECFACLDVTPLGSVANLGCTSSKPNCFSGDRCVFCQKGGVLPDFGCGGTTTVCGLIDGTPLVNAGDEGSKCFFCENTSEANDPGCTVAGMGVCVAEEGKLGSSCVLCQNDRGSDAGIDLGCAAGMQKCGFANGTTLPINGFGDNCMA